MTEESVVLVGGGGHASDVLQAIEACNAVDHRYDVLGIVADQPHDERRFRGRGVSYLGGIETLRNWDARYVLCIGYPWQRAEVARRIDGLAEPVNPIIAPSCDVGVGVTLGPGSVLLGNCHVSAFAQMGAHSVVSYTASIGHDTAFGDFGTVMPGANIGGDVVAGREVLVGSGAVVLEKLTLGDRVRVGAGAAVIAALPADVTVVGVPARVRSSPGSGS